MPKTIRYIVVSLIAITWTAVPLWFAYKHLGIDGVSSVLMLGGIAILIGVMAYPPLYGIVWLVDTIRLALWLWAKGDEDD